MGLEERARLVRLVTAYLKGGRRVRPVWAWAAGVTAEQAGDEARALAEAGAAGVVVSAPPFYRLAEEELVAFFGEAAERAGDVPLALHNLPRATGNALTEAELARLLDDGAPYVALIDSSGDRELFHEFLEHGERIALIQGDESQLLDTLTFGVSGCAPAGANVTPLLFREFVDRADDLEAVEALNREVYALKRDVCGLPQMPEATSGIYTALRLLGIGDGPPAPFMRMTSLEEGRDVEARILPTLRHLAERLPPAARERVL